MSNFFDNMRAKYNDPNTPEFEKGVALGRMQEMENQRMQYNKKANPEKYHADVAKKLKDKADYHEKQAKQKKGK